MICIQLYSIKYSNTNNFKTSIWPIDGTLTGITTPGQSGPENDRNERMLYTPKSSRTGASLPDLNSLICKTVQILVYKSLLYIGLLA